MSNIVTAAFRPGYKQVHITGSWQYDYGQILRIQGLKLPPAIEVHFSSTEVGGSSVTRIGVTRDGITDVPIPDSLLEGGGATRNYAIYAFLYVADDSSGNTEYKIALEVQARPIPEVPGIQEESELFREAIKVVNEAAERVEQAKEIDREQIEANKRNIQNLQDAMKLRPEIQTVSELPQDAAEHPNTLYLVLDEDGG